MAARSMLRAFAKVSVATAVVVGGAAAGAGIASAGDHGSTRKLRGAVSTRLSRDIVAEWKSSSSEGTEERLKDTHEVHLMSAHRLEELCFKSGGIYISSLANTSVIWFTYMHTVLYALYG